MRESLRKRLTLIFIGLAVTPLLLVGAVLLWQGYSTQKQQALALQQQTARCVATEVSGFLRNLENELSMTGRLCKLQITSDNQQIEVLH